MSNLNVPLPDDLIKQVQEYSKTSGYKIWKIVECALLHYFDKLKKIKKDK